MKNRLINYAIILASGSGKRFQTDTPKQFVKINDKTILEHTVENFEKSENIDRIIVAVTHKYIEQTKELLQGYKKIYKVIAGGETRKDSSYNAVSSIPEEEANVLIHDGARPFISKGVIDDCIIALNSEIKALTTAIPMTDTVVATKSGIVNNIPDRNNLMRVQTPQGFKLSIIKKAHQLAKDDNNFTDDCGLILKHKLADIHIINGNTDNIKITYPQDIYFAKKLMKN